MRFDPAHLPRAAPPQLPAVLHRPGPVADRHLAAAGRDGLAHLPAHRLGVAARRRRVLRATSASSCSARSPASSPIASTAAARSIVTQSLMLAQALALAALTAFGHVEVWHLIALRAVARHRVGVRRAAAAVALRASRRRPRRPAQRDRAQFVHRQHGARSSARRSPGMLLSLVGEALCFALNALSFVAVIVAIARLRWPRGGACRGDRRLVGELVSRARATRSASRRRARCWRWSPCWRGRSRRIRR